MKDIVPQNDFKPRANWAYFRWPSLVLSILIFYIFQFSAQYIEQIEPSFSLTCRSSSARFAAGRAVHKTNNS